MSRLDEKVLVMEISILSFYFTSGLNTGLLHKLKSFYYLTGSFKFFFNLEVFWNKAAHLIFVYNL